MRNSAIIAVLYRGGLHLVDAHAIEWHDHHVPACALNVRHGKGKRIMGMDSATFDLVTRWRDGRDRRVHYHPSVVFCTLDGHPRQVSIVRMLLTPARA